MSDNFDADTAYEVLLLKFVVSAIIDHAPNREQLLKYIRANLETFSEIANTSEREAPQAEKIKELLEFLESGERRPKLTGKPPNLKLVRVDDSDD